MGIIKQLFLPNQYVNSIYEIDFDKLKQLNIKGIITDLDNTLVGWDEAQPTPKVENWFKTIDEQGFKVTVVSNNNEQRVKSFCQNLKVDYIFKAQKPRGKALRRATEQMGMQKDEVVLKSFKYGAHASNLSAMIGYQLGQKYNIPVFTTDPVVVDELIDEVRHTGVPSIQRRSIFHALNQKAMARRYAALVNRAYENMNVIVIHMGGGISIGAHEKGRVIDVNEALYGEGPMAMDRSGSIPNDLLVQYMDKHQLSADEIKVQLSRESGLKAYFQTSDLREIMAKYEQDENVKLIIDTMVIQIAKVIGERAVVLKGHVDQIIFTGGMSHSVQLMDQLAKYIEWIAPISVFPGEHELITLAERAQLALNQQIKIEIYQ
ncbi:butyrate kinase [Staphylococcus pseudintermedius]|nr:butyrate kinase [Staphylococcus pseudintermedius]